MKLILKNCVLTTVVIISFAVCSFTTFYFYKSWKSRKPPKKWRKVGNVLKLYSYPLKSGRYIEHKRVECTKFGFSSLKTEGVFQLRDRSFIIYGASDLVGKSARIYPGMVLISISSNDENHITLQAPKMEAISVEIPIKNNENVQTIKFQNWSDEHVPTIHCGEEVSKWISQYLLQKDHGLHLGYHDVSSYRSISSFKNKEDLNFYKYVTDAAFGLYADLAAGLLLNEKTLIDLNEKLVEKVASTQFRPNIVVDGPELMPFDEDDWFWLKIGDVIVRNIKDCTRCVLSTVDPETGVRNINREPLKTLSKYRISKGPGKGPIMGVNLEVVVPGVININDEVWAGMVD